MAQRSGNLQAVALLLVAVVLISLVPPVLVASGGAGSPFLFNAMWRLGTALGCFLLLSIHQPGLMFNKLFWRLVRGRAGHWMVLLLVFNGVEYGLFSAPVGSEGRQG